MTKIENQCYTKLMQKELHLPDHPFWRFNLALNAQESVRRALCQAQLYPAIQINLLLYCCWFAQAGRGRLTKHDIQQLSEVIATWHHRILKPLEELLQSANTPRKALLELQKNISAEIELADHIEQLFLADVPIKFNRTSRNPNQKLIDACKNMALYCRMQQVPINEGLSAAFYELLAAVFPKVDLRETQKAVQTLLLQDSFFPQTKLALD